MKQFSPLKLDARKDPNALLRLFITCSFVSMLLVMVVAGLSFRGTLQRYVTRNAEEDAINVSSALLAEERGRIVAKRPDGSYAMQVNPKDLPGLDRHIRTFLSPFNIVKIKIYSADCRIVYSTDAKIIGEVNTNNVRLKRALAGHFDSKLEKKEEVHDLADEVMFNVDVVETYIPVFDNSKRVIGSFEIYMDVTKYREDSKRAMVAFLSLLAAILALGFGLSYPFIRKGTKDVRQIQEMLKKETITDPLTGIYNKREIVAIAQREFSRSLRRRNKGAPDCELSFIMLDVDRFKQTNDQYGHLGGDALLKQLADRVVASLRTYDAVGRFGGEEFLVILPSADPEQARSVAQKIWRLVREEPFRLEGEEVSLTASLGIATCRNEDTEYAEVLRRADQALYRAKSEGRDRVLA